MHPWPLRQLPHIDITVGACAWTLSLASSPDGARYLLDHPSLIVVGLDELDQQPAAHARDAISKLPIALHFQEPDFIRHLPAQLEKKLALLGRDQVDAVILHVEELADIKSGSAIQMLAKLREQGKLRHIGIAASTALDAEWLAGISSARILSIPFSIDDQSVRYRALAALEEFSMTALADPPLTISPSPESLLAARFALAAAPLALPVLNTKLPPDFSPLPEPEFAAIWTTFQTAHAPPPLLPRSRPPE